MSPHSYCKSICGADLISSDNFYFRFSDFGAYPKEKSGKIEVIYDKEWDIPVKIYNVDDGGKVLETDEKFSFEGEEFLLSHAIITPSAITLNFSSESELAGVENFSCVDVSIKLKDGKILLPTIDAADIKDFSVSVFDEELLASGWKGSYIVLFDEEVKPGDIVSVTIGDNTIDLAG